MKTFTRTRMGILKALNGGSPATCDVEIDGVTIPDVPMLTASGTLEDGCWLLEIGPGQLLFLGSVVRTP